MCYQGYDRTYSEDTEDYNKIIPRIITKVINRNIVNEKLNIFWKKTFENTIDYWIKRI